MPDPSLLLGLLSSPAILFFILGLLAAFAGSDLELPKPVSQALSLYLMLAIGFKGGVEARAAGLTLGFVSAAGLGLAFSASLPVLAWLVLRRTTRLDRATAAALAAAYGSVSVVTFAAAQQYLQTAGLTSSGYMAAVLALMEAPAILTALILLRRQTEAGSASWTSVVRHAALGSAGVMLLGSFAVGLISGEAGMAKLDLFVNPLFQGVLCLFLLELGLEAARGLLKGHGRLSRGVVAFCIAFPACAALTALAVARATGLLPGDAALLGVLAGSASYIAVPAAMRLAAPGADPTVYVTGPLALTFPFNLLVGIPVYVALAATPL